MPKGIYNRKTRGMSPKDRLMENSIPEPNTGCWIWLLSICREGYGITTLSKIQMGAHRAAFIVFNGQIPKGMCVLHRCDNRPCINPQHLFIGTQLDNVADMISKGRSKFLGRIRRYTSGKGMRYQQNESSKAYYVKNKETILKKLKEKRNENNNNDKNNNEN